MKRRAVIAGLMLVLDVLLELCFRAEQLVYWVGDRIGAGQG